MSGHSKWSKIKRKKGANDQKRGKVFSRISKEITIAVKEGGGTDPGFNSRLRLAINNAKGVNMPKDVIQRAIKKGADTGGAGYTALNYEGYAPGGVAIFVECLTDNTNRTVANVRALFNKNGGNLSTSGSVAFMFDRKGIFEFKKAEHDIDDLTLELIDFGAEELEEDTNEEEEAIIRVITDYTDFGNMVKKLEEMGIEVSSATLQMIAQQPQEVDGDTAKKALRMIELVEEDDDVQAVYHNMDLTEEVMASVDAE